MEDVITILAVMGRWAQARRRGGAARVSGPAGPPPAPLLTWEGENLVQTATGENDLGGMVRLWVGSNPGGPYTEELSNAWGPTRNWGDRGSLPMGYLVATEEGNGSAYVGASAYSNEVTN